MSPGSATLPAMIPPDTSADVQWRDNRLRIRYGHTDWVLSGWPDLRAWQWDPLGWRRAWPAEFDISQASDLTAPAVNWCFDHYDGVWGWGCQQELPLFDCVRQRLAQAPAWQAFYATFPTEIIEIVRHFVDGQWACLVLLALHPAARELGKAHPNMLWALANASQFTAAEKASLLAWRLPDILAACGFPRVCGLRQMLDRIAPSQFTDFDFVAQFKAALADPDTVALLRHTAPGEYALYCAIVDPHARPWLTSKLLAELQRTEVGSGPGIWDLLDVAQSGAAPVPLQCRAHLERTVTRLRTELLVRTLRPPPALPPDRRIRPLQTVAELRAEGRDMHNCLFTRCFSYARRIEDGHLYAYAVLEPRLTMTLAPGKHGWEIEELCGPGNESPGGMARMWLERWARGGPAC